MSAAPEVARGSSNAAGEDFAAVLGRVRGVAGWLSDAQARRLWEAAGAVRPPGRVIEIGSFRGRSTIVLATAAAPGVEVVAIDPHEGGDRGPQEIAADASRGRDDFAAFADNLRAAGLQERVRHVRERSSQALAAVTGEVELLYVDGAHRYGPARADIEQWGARVAPGGTMLVHDAFNAVGVTLAQLRGLVVTSRWRYLGRTGSLAEYRRESLDSAAIAANALRQLAELPYFVRNGLVKVALVAKLRPLAALLGHHGGDWPY